MRADMPEGTVFFQWPTALSVESVEAIEQLITLQLRAIRRTAERAKAQAPGGDGDA
jgi:predicted component of type VI protein secretion system